MKMLSGGDVGWGKICLALLPVLGPSLAASSDESTKRQGWQGLSALVSQCLHFKEKKLEVREATRPAQEAALKWQC